MESGWSSSPSQLPFWRHCKQASVRKAAPSSTQATLDSPILIRWRSAHASVKELIDGPYWPIRGLWPESCTSWHPWDYRCKLEAAIAHCLPVPLAPPSANSSCSWATARIVCSFQTQPRLQFLLFFPLFLLCTLYTLRAHTSDGESDHRCSFTLMHLSEITDSFLLEIR